jgi:hypothetical protein
MGAALQSITSVSDVVEKLCSPFDEGKNSSRDVTLVIRRQVKLSEPSKSLPVNAPKFEFRNEAR